jgi:hypothetical protein
VGAVYSGSSRPPPGGYAGYGRLLCERQLGDGSSQAGNLRHDGPVTCSATPASRTWIFRYSRPSLSRSVTTRRSEPRSSICSITPLSRIHTAHRMATEAPLVEPMTWKRQHVWLRVRHTRRGGRQSAGWFGKQPRDATRVEVHSLRTSASSRGRQIDSPSNTCHRTQPRRRVSCPQRARVGLP